MKHFTKSRSNNEVMEFNAKFKNKNKSYVLTSDGINILNVKTDDKEIIAYVKALGLKIE